MQMAAMHIDKFLFIEEGTCRNVSVFLNDERQEANSDESDGKRLV